MTALELDSGTCASLTPGFADSCVTFEPAPETVPLFLYWEMGTIMPSFEHRKV